MRANPAWTRSSLMAYGLQDVIVLRQMVDNSDADETRKRLEVYLV